MATRLILEDVFDHEAQRAQQPYLTQPVGGGSVREYTWGQVMNEARRMAAHLRSLGLSPGDKVAILSKNCAHFFIAELAIWLAGGTTVAIYATEGADTVRYVLEHSDARVLFVGKLDTWARQASGIPGAITRIALPLGPAEAGTGWDEIIARTPPLEGRPLRAPEDLAMIAYTSGSTGVPKGVMHSFANMSVAVRTIAELNTSGQDERMLSYLPLAHVYERAYVECLSFVSGRVHVSFAESMDTFLADLKRARPTIFLSVPRLWLKFQQGVFARLPARRLELLLRLPIIGRRVGARVLEGLGLGSVRLAGSGSAPIPAELISWYRRLGLNLLEGYAMTEDFALSHVSTEAMNAPGYVGVPCPGVEVRIAEDGEVLIRSPGRLVGYYKRPDLDAEAFTPDGFFHTGDTGERRADGMLRVTGRVKELFKTAKGKYVAPAPIENLLNEHPLIELSCVTGVGQPAAFALVVLDEAVRTTQHQPETRARVERELGAWLTRVNTRLAVYEQLKLLVVVTRPWTIEEGTLTPTLKLKRARIEAQCAAHQAAWFASEAKVQWA